MEQRKNLKDKAISGFLWKFGEKCSMQVVQFVISLIIARKLGATAYGIAGLFTVFSSIASTIVQNGFTSALIQKKDPDDIDCSSVFYANMVMSIVLYIILFFCAPFIATLYHQEILVNITRVSTLGIVIGSFGTVSNTIMQKQLDFKKSFIRYSMGVLTHGIVGLTLVFTHPELGAWVLVISTMSNTIVSNLVIVLTVKWKPKRLFSFQRLKSLFSYSSKILGTNLLNTIFNNINTLIVGIFYTAADLGTYQKGQNIPQTVMTSIDGSMNEVMFPALSTIKDNPKLVKESLRKSMRTSTYITTPCLCGMIAIAEAFILLALGEAWHDTILYMQLFCVICMFWPLSARTHGLNAIGKSGTTLMLSTIGKIISLVLTIAPLIAFSIMGNKQYGLVGSLLGTILASFIGVTISSYFTKKYLDYSLWELVKDLLPTLMLSGIMLACAWSVKFFIGHLLVRMIVQIVVGITVYVGLSVITKNEQFLFLLDFVKKFLHLKKEKTND